MRKIDEKLNDFNHLNMLAMIGKKNYYQILGLTAEASMQEIRRAYRILARRYHPDVNPETNSSEKFREIAEAYEVLSDPKQKALIDSVLSDRTHKDAVEKIKAYEEAQRRYKESQGKSGAYKNTQQNTQQAKPAPKAKTPELGFTKWVKGTYESLSSFVKQKPVGPKSISLLELPLTLTEAIYGCKKMIEVAELKKNHGQLSVNVPRGARPGEILKLRRKSEELIFIIKIIQKKQFELEAKGLVMNLDLSVVEAAKGAELVVPTPQGEVKLKIPVKVKSGTELKLKGKGILERDNTIGDFFVRLSIQLPEDTTSIENLSISSPKDRVKPGQTFESLLKD